LAYNAFYAGRCIGVNPRGAVFRARSKNKTRAIL
jgi:hypothetical protein